MNTVSFTAYTVQLINYKKTENFHDKSILQFFFHKFLILNLSKNQSDPSFLRMLQGFEVTEYFRDLCIICVVSPHDQWSENVIK